MKSHSISILFTVIILYLFLWTFLNFHNNLFVSPNRQEWETTSNIKDFLLIKKEKTDNYWNTCQLPNYDIWDEQIMPFIDPDRNPFYNCDRKFKPWTELKNSEWKIVTTKKNVNCRARCHLRQNERNNIIGKWTKMPGKVNCEVLETVCSQNKTDQYGYLHSQIIETNSSKKTNKNLNEFDVFIITIDSLSYSQAKRSLPRTLSYFTEHMNGVLFPYVNKVGQNSRPNGVALWFGKSAEKIDRTRFDEEIIPEDWKHEYICNYFKDNETHIFKEFRNFGYKTLLAEDWALGVLNYPNCRGFNKTPTDHYMRPFQVAYEKSAKLITRKHLEGNLCKETYNTLLEYFDQFIDSYQDQKKFAWIWASHLAHDSENGVFRADGNFHRFFLKNRKKFENAFVFFHADHGLRFGPIHQTFIGSLDDNNPFLAISIPKTLRENTGVLEILKENSKTIQTHYDTRATLLDILKHQPVSSFLDKEPLIMKGEKGNSLIRKQPNFPRNCRTLPIPLEYCICNYNSTSLEKNSTLANQIGNKIAEKVNMELKTGNFSKNCIEMVFEQIKSIIQFDQTFKGTVFYKAVAEMKKPSKARFQAYIKKTVNHRIEVLGTVERTNKYGKTADCIKKSFYRPYCHCKTNN